MLVCVIRMFIEDYTNVPPTSSLHYRETFLSCVYWYISRWRRDIFMPWLYERLDVYERVVSFFLGFQR